MALQAVARNQGDVELTARELINDEFQVPAATLIDWITETHAEQYSRIVDGLGAEQERRVIRQAQDTLVRAGEVQSELVEAIATQLHDGKIRPEVLPQSLRSITDVRAKSVNSLLLLTGRSVTGNTGEATVEAMTRLVNSLQGLGLVKVAPSIAATLGSEDVQEADVVDGG